MRRKVRIERKCVRRKLRIERKCMRRKEISRGSMYVGRKEKI
jgi:hypothetical protein